MKLKGPLIVFGAAVLGEWITERFVIKDGPDDTGFIARSPGFGMDEIARGAIIAIFATVALKMFAGRK